MFADFYIIQRGRAKVVRWGLSRFVSCLKQGYLVREPVIIIYDHMIIIYSSFIHREQWSGTGGERGSSIIYHHLRSTYLSSITSSIYDHHLSSSSSHHLSSRIVVYLSSSHLSSSRGIYLSSSSSWPAVRGSRQVEFDIICHHLSLHHLSSASHELHRQRRLYRRLSSLCASPSSSPGIIYIIVVSLDWLVCRRHLSYRHGDRPSMTICHHWHPRHFLSDTEQPLLQPSLTTQLVTALTDHAAVTGSESLL